MSEKSGNTGNELISNPIRTPLVDVSMKEDEYILRCELPGVQKEDIDIVIDENELTIRTERNWGESGRVLIKEIPQYGFKRTFLLSDTLDNQNISASFSRGVLTLVLGRKERVKKRMIPISD